MISNREKVTVNNKFGAERCPARVSYSRCLSCRPDIITEGFSGRYTVKVNANPTKPAMSSRSKLLNATANCISQYGIDQVAISHIVKEAGVSRPTFYSHFGDLDGVLADIWVEHGEAWALTMCDPSATVQYGDAQSRALLEIFLVAHRKPQILEAIKAQMPSLVDKRFPDVADQTIALWTFANRLGMSATVGVWHPAARAAILDSYLESVRGKISNLVPLETEELAPIADSSDQQIESELLLGALTVVQNSGVPALTVSRLARVLGVTSAYVYPRMTGTGHLAAQAFDYALTQATKTNVDRWQAKKLGVEGFSEYIVGGLSNSRENWRRFRAEVLLAARHIPELRTGVPVALDAFAERIMKPISVLPVPKERRRDLSALVHTTLLGFSALQAAGIPVKHLAHVGIIQAMVRELGKRVLTGSATT